MKRCFMVFKLKLFIGFAVAFAGGLSNDTSFDAYSFETRNQFNETQTTYLEQPHGRDVTPADAQVGGVQENITTEGFRASPVPRGIVGVVTKAADFDALALHSKNPKHRETWASSYAATSKTKLLRHLSFIPEFASSAFERVQTSAVLKEAATRVRNAWIRVKKSAVSFAVSGASAGLEQAMWLASTATTGMWERQLETLQHYHGLFGIESPSSSPRALLSPVHFRESRAAAETLAGNRVPQAMASCVVSPDATHLLIPLNMMHPDLTARVITDDSRQTEGDFHAPAHNNNRKPQLFHAMLFVWGHVNLRQQTFPSHKPPIERNPFGVQEIRQMCSRGTGAHMKRKAHFDNVLGSWNMRAMFTVNSTSPTIFMPLHTPLFYVDGSKRPESVFCIVMSSLENHLISTRTRQRNAWVHSLRIYRQDSLFNQKAAHPFPTATHREALHDSQPELKAYSWREPQMVTALIQSPPLEQVPFRQNVYEVFVGRTPCSWRHKAKCTMFAFRAAVQQPQCPSLLRKLQQSSRPKMNTNNFAGFLVYTLIPQVVLFLFLSGCILQAGALMSWLCGSNLRLPIAAAVLTCIHITRQYATGTLCTAFCCIAAQSLCLSPAAALSQLASAAESVFAQVQSDGNNHTEIRCTGKPQIVEDLVLAFKLKLKPPTDESVAGHPARSDTTGMRSDGSVVADDLPSPPENARAAGKIPQYSALGFYRSEKVAAATWRQSARPLGKAARQERRKRRASRPPRSRIAPNGSHDFHAAVMDEAHAHIPERDNPLWSRGRHELDTTKQTRFTRGLFEVPVEPAETPASTVTIDRSNCMDVAERQNAPGGADSTPGPNKEKPIDLEAPVQLQDSMAAPEQTKHEAPAGSGYVTETHAACDFASISEGLQHEKLAEFRKALAVGAPLPAVAAKIAATLVVAFESATVLVELLARKPADRAEHWGSLSSAQQASARDILAQESEQTQPLGCKLPPSLPAAKGGLAAAMAELMGAGGKKNTKQAKRQPKAANKSALPKLKRFAWAVIREVPPKSIWRELESQVQLSEDRLQTLLSQASIALSGCSIVTSPTTAQTSGLWLQRQEEPPRAGAGASPSVDDACAAHTDTLPRAGISMRPTAAPSTAKDMLLHEFRGLFAQPSKQGKKHGKAGDAEQSKLAPTAGKPCGAPAVLGPKRVMNLNIAWRRLGISARELQCMVQRLDNRVLVGANEAATQSDATPSVRGPLLDDSQLALLPNLLVSKDELRNLKQASEGIRSKQLSNLEKMLLSLNLLPGCKERLHALSVSASWQTRAAELQATLHAMQQCADRIQSCAGLRAVLVAALALARTASLSEQSAAGEQQATVVQGVRLSTLSTLDRTKASDGRSTVLHYLESMASCIQTDAVQQIAAVTSARCTAAAARVPLASLAADLSVLSNDIIIMQQVSNGAALASDASLVEFCRLAQQRVQQLQDCLLQAQVRFADMLDFFGESVVGNSQGSPQQARDRACANANAWVKALVDLAAKLQRVQADRLRWMRTRAAALKRQGLQKRDGGGT